MHVFPRLYSVAANKNLTVEEAGLWHDDSWYWQLPWRRSLFSSEETECAEEVNLLTGISLIRSECVKWVWKYDVLGRLIT